MSHEHVRLSEGTAPKITEAGKCYGANDGKWEGRYYELKCLMMRHTRLAMVEIMGMPNDEVY